MQDHSSSLSICVYFECLQHSLVYQLLWFAIIPCREVRSSHLAAASPASTGPARAKQLSTVQATTVTHTLGVQDNILGTIFRRPLHVDIVEFCEFHAAVWGMYLDFDGFDYLPGIREYWPGLLEADLTKTQHKKIHGQSQLPKRSIGSLGLEVFNLLGASGLSGCQRGPQDVT